MSIESICEYIQWLPSSKDPLSSDVFLIQGKEYNYIFDVGACEEARNWIQTIEKRTLILSHFHGDHSGNMPHFPNDPVFLGKKTAEKVGHGNIVRETQLIHDGMQLEIIPLPSVHAKDSLALNVNHKYLLVGDALYGANIQGRHGYNVSVLYDTIRCLSSIEAEFVLKSHDSQLIYSMKEEIQRLETIYQQKIPGQPYIFLD